jgi:hypothetical protein
MSSEQSPAAPPPAGPGRRRPPTIDLTAEEARTDPSAGGTKVPPGQSPSPPGRISKALLAAGAAGAVVIMLVIAALFALRAPGERPLEARLTRVEQELRGLASRPLPERSDGQRLDELTARMDRLEAMVTAPRSPASDPALANRISALEGELKAMGETVAILSRRSDEIALAARDARQRAESTAAATAELTQRVSRPDAPAIGRGELEGLASRVAAVERTAKSLEAELAKGGAAAGGDQGARLAVAATALKTAVERGEPFAAELAAVKALAANPETLAALDGFAASGVPTPAALARELAGLAPALHAATGAPPRDGGILDKLQANAEKLVRIRPLDEVSGSDPAAIVARIEVKAARADLTGALAELEQLPAIVRAPAEPWIAKAQARATAVTTSRRLAADALSAVVK